MWLFSIQVITKIILYNWKLKPDKNTEFSLAGLKTCTLLLMKSWSNVCIPHYAGGFHLVPISETAALMLILRIVVDLVQIYTSMKGIEEHNN